LEDEKLNKINKRKKYKIDNSCDAHCKVCKKARIKLADLKMEMKNREKAIKLKYKNLHHLVDLASAEPVASGNIEI